MATVSRTERPLRPQVESLLDRLRARIRTYVALEGTAVLLAVLAGLFWLTLLIAYAYFWLTNLELPIPFRVGVLLTVVGISVAAAGFYLAFRLVRKLRTKALALVLERRFPELNDRLILAVENAERLSAEPRNLLQESMLARATDDVAVAVEKLDLADVFDRRPLHRATLAAAVLLVPIVLLVAFQPDIVETWWDAYIRLADVYHVRETSLQLTILAPPDDRPRRIEPGGVYKHPRGANLTLLFDVPEDHPPDSKPWVVPELVSVRRHVVEGGRQTLPAMKVGERHFRVTIEEVRGGMDLWVTGGDYTNSSPFRIDVVDPPRLSRVEFQNLYPDYTRLNQRGADGQAIPDRVALTGPITKVPAGTLVLFRGTTNKPIRNARIRLGENELAFGEFDEEDSGSTLHRAVLTVRDVEGEGSGTRYPIPEDVAKTFISEDRQTISLPLLVTDGAVSFMPKGPNNRTDIPEAPTITVPLITPFRVTLEDTDRVSSIDASRFELRGAPDEPPKLSVKLRGVSEKITRTATIPVEGGITDDHGIVDARFDFKASDDDEWDSRPFRNAPEGQPKEFRLQREPNSPVEWLDTATLNLKLGQRLTVAVAAVDNDVIAGPKIAKSDEFQFSIVSAEELLTDLYNREINQRKAFERSLEEMKQVRLDLADYKERTPEVQQNDEAAWRMVQAATDRAYAETRQNANEVTAISSSFRQILEELVNNRLHTEKQLDRIRVGVLLPLQNLVDQRFPTLDRAVGQLRLQVSDRRELSTSFDQSIESADRLIAEMEAALREMQDLAEFHEAIQELNLIFTDEQKLLDRTKEEQKRSVIDSLGDLLD